MADALDSKSSVLHGRVGSTPTFGTLPQAMSAICKRAQNPGLSGIFAFLAVGVRMRNSLRTNSQPLSPNGSDSQIFGPGLGQWLGQ